MEPHTGSNRGVAGNDENPLAAIFNQDPNAGKTVIRIRVENGVQVSLNSLIAPAVTSFFQDMVTNVSQMFPNW